MTDEQTEISPDEFVGQVISAVVGAVLRMPIRVVVISIPLDALFCEAHYRYKPRAVHRRIWAYLRGWTC